MIQACNCDFAESVRSGTDCVVVVACIQVNNLGEVYTEGDEKIKNKKLKQNNAQSAHAQSTHKGVN